MIHRALILSPNKRIGVNLQKEFQNHHIEVGIELSESYIQALDYISRFHYDLIVLVESTPEYDGISVAYKIKELSDAAILIISACDEEENSLMPLHCDTSCIMASSFGIKINPRLQKVYVDGEDLGLTHTQFRILQNLVHHVGEVVTKDQLFADVWETTYDINADSVLKYQIKEIRRKMERVGIKGLVRTKWGIGYYLNLSM